jgi:hypothetical protein
LADDADDFGYSEELMRNHSASHIKEHLMKRRTHRAMTFVWLLMATLSLPGAGAEKAAAASQDQVVTLKDANTFQAEYRVGVGGKIGLEFTFADGKKQTLLGVVKSDVMQRTLEKDGKKLPTSTAMPDAFVEYKGAGLLFRHHVRPNLVRYTETQREGVVKDWDAIPAATSNWTPLEVRVQKAGAELWIAGRYCGLVASESKLVEVRFQLAEGGAVRGEQTSVRPSTGLFLPLDVKHIARPGVMKEASVSLKPGMQQFKNVPMIVGDAASNADVGVVKEMQGLRFLETNENTSRTSLDGMKESLHFSVPQAFYNRAWVLCAVENDPKKDAVLTTRLTRFGVAGRGGAIADTTLTLPRGDEKPGAGVEVVGSVHYPVDGKQITAPLYLVEVHLHAGEILDTLAETKDPFAALKIGPYLDFEFLGKMGGLEVQTDRRRKPVSTSVSAVHVFGATLERSPVELRLKQSQPGNIFHNDEVPETTFALHADVGGAYTLRWEISDVTGKLLQTQSKTVSLKAGEDADITLPLKRPELGWYGLRVMLMDAKDHMLMKHDAAFALLGKDTRTAGYESPFGMWWFGSAHYATSDIQVAGPLMFKAGMRRTTPGWTKATEADLAPWKITLNQVRWSFRLADLDDWPAAEVRAEKSIRDMLERFPHCQYILLFHESYNPGAYPPELYDAKYEPKDAALAKQDDRLFELGVKAAKFIRAKFPQLKIIAGNSGGSSGMIAVLLRRGFPRELIDYLGTETTGQTIAPEKLSPHTTAGIWLMGETARKLGYDIPMSGCYEYTSRAERDLGPQRTAEWYSRDMLFGLANRFPTISPGEVEDVGNAYYDTLWGAAGYCQRRPLHYPKPVYVAMATLTKVLDSVKLVRQMDTGSSSVYALEFERGNERIYAVWTPRGQCEMEFEFNADTDVANVSFYGQPSSLKTNGKRLKVTASPAVHYLVSPVAAVRASAGRRSFDLPPVNTDVVARMDDVSRWQLDPTDAPITEPTRKPGKFELRQVKDAEKGECLELALNHEGVVPAVVGEYTALRLKEPVPIPGQPHSVGLWVKGDSSWGRVFWEITDAKGERWRSSGGYDGGDWASHSSMDFDGWCFLSFPLTNGSHLMHVEPSPGLGQWQRQGGDGKLDYPLKFTGLFIETHRQSLNLTKMSPVKCTIRLKDLCVIGGTK